MTLYTRQQAAEALGISVRTLDEERQTGKLSYIQRRAGCRVMISEDQLKEYVQRYTHKAKPVTIRRRKKK